MKDLFAHFAPKKSDTPKKEREIVGGDVAASGVDSKKPKGKKKRKVISETGNHSSEEVVVVESPKGSKRKKPLALSSGKSCLRTKILSLEKDSGNGSCEESSPSPERETSASGEKTPESVAKKRKRGSNSSGTCDDSFELNDSRNSLLNYFNKVDKLPDIPQKPPVLQVQAIVHDPPSTEKKTSKSIKKKKSKKERFSVQELDLITSEEDAQSPEQKENLVPSKWNLRIRLGPSRVGEEASDSLSSFPSTLDCPSEDSKSSIDCVLAHCQESENQKKGLKEVVKEDCSSATNESSLIAECVVVLEESNDEIIDVDGDVSLSDFEMKTPVTKSKHDGTLMSFFKCGNQKSVPKPMSSLDKKAKMRFLSSGVPDVMKKMMNAKAKEEKEKEGEPAPFPKHCHVRQEEKMNIVWNLKEVEFPLKENKQVPRLSEWSSLGDCDDENPTKEIVPALTSSQIKAELKVIKKKENELPISTWRSSLKEVKKGKKDNEMWTNKYKPQAVNEFLGNQQNIIKLQSWLEGYKKTFKEAEGESSSNEFVSSDDEMPVKKNVALLVGPCASGKTAAVYTIAQTLGYKVLEVNSSSDRTGKKILHELVEATQSHKVKHNALTPKEKKSKKKRKKLIEEEVEMSLILIEDADIVFEQHDEGFSSAVSSLASSSKRPLVLIANEHPNHMGKLTTNIQLTLNFKPYPPDKLGRWLQVLALTEGFSLPDPLAELISKVDIRKALLNLQFYKRDTSLKLIEPPNNISSHWAALGESNLNHTETKRFSHLLSTWDLICPEERDFPLRYWECKECDSCSTSDVCSPFPSQLTSDIRRFISSQLPAPDYTSNDFDSRLKEVKSHMDEIDLSLPLSTVLSRRSYYLDYVPTFRKIAESERSRLSAHTKRNNRFLNYLHNLGFPPSESLIDFLVSSFS